MVGGRPLCLSYFYIQSTVLLLGVRLLDVEASSCLPIIHKKVGDTVELPSCSSAENVTVLTWKLNNALVVDKGASVVIPTLFRDRVSLNPTNFSLTVRKLTLQDSGNFTFISAVNDKQRPTVHITLQVHEHLTKEPVLTFNSTWDASNKSCTVLLECRSTSDSRVTYNWTVKTQTLNGSRLQYKIRPEDGDTTFTCTISNFISDKSASQTVKCSNNTSEPPGSLAFVLIIGVIGGSVLMIVIIVTIAVGVCHCKKRQAGSDSNDLTVYADVNDFAFEDRTSSMKPCSVYETIDNRINPVIAGPQTVYDKIQLSRVRKSSVSPYQEVS